MRHQPSIAPIAPFPFVAQPSLPSTSSEPPLAAKAPVDWMARLQLAYAKKYTKWSPEEDAMIIELRGSGLGWEDISAKLPGRSAIGCRLHYRKYIERRGKWDEDKKNKLARLYKKFRAEMWSNLAKEMAIPWETAEAMHWSLGEQEMARRADSSRSREGPMSPQPISAQELTTSVPVASTSVPATSSPSPRDTYHI